MKSKYLQTNSIDLLLKDSNIFIKNLTNQYIVKSDDTLVKNKLLDSDLNNYLTSKEFLNLSNYQKISKIYLLAELEVDLSNDTAKQIITEIISKFKTKDNEYSQNLRKPNIITDLSSQILYIAKKARIKIENSEELLKEITFSQRVDGGWGFTPSLKQTIMFLLFGMSPKEKNIKVPSNINKTIKNILTLLEYQDEYFDSQLIELVVDNGALFLLDNYKKILEKNSNLKFSTLDEYDIVSILSILNRSNHTKKPQFTTLFNYLISKQNSNDQWDPIPNNSAINIDNIINNNNSTKWMTYRVLKLFREIKDN